MQNSALMYACEYAESNNLIIVRTLLNAGADPNLKNARGVCPLLGAVEKVNIIINCYYSWAIPPPPRPPPANKEMQYWVLLHSP